MEAKDELHHVLLVDEEHYTSVGTTMTKVDAESIHQALRKNVDLSAWTTVDLPRVNPDIITHRLSVYKEARSVAQNKRNHREEKRMVAKEEADKLLVAGFIREARYTTWPTNIVMVTKSNEKWQMCVDYKDLNKACPKHSYPLPNIDRLVDGATDHKVLSFLDAYSGYNQISMHPKDKDKTAFTTDNANYFYKVMPFGLKNAGATYQRLMETIFKGMIGKSVEVYVDDIVLKSDSYTQHIKDLQEVFDTLRRTNMRLNLDKCAFGAEGGKFHVNPSGNQGKPRQVQGDNRDKKPKEPEGGATTPAPADSTIQIRSSVGRAN